MAKYYEVLQHHASAVELETSGQQKVEKKKKKKEQTMKQRHSRPGGPDEEEAKREGKGGGEREQGEKRGKRRESCVTAEQTITSREGGEGDEADASDEEVVVVWGKGDVALRLFGLRTDLSHARTFSTSVIRISLWYRSVYLPTGTALILDQSNIDSEDDTPDLQVLDSAGREQSPGTLDHVAYMKRFNLVQPPFQEGQKMTKDRDIAMTNYFKQPPRLEYPQKMSILLLRRIARQDREEPEWARHLECTVCLEEGAMVILSCGCRETIFHQGCVERWHRTQNPSCKRTLRCPSCNERSKPINLEWATKPAAEREACRKADKARKHAATKKKRHTDPIARAKEAQKRELRFEKIRSQRAAEGKTGPGPSWLSLEPTDESTWPTQLIGQSPPASSTAGAMRTETQVSDNKKFFWNYSKDNIAIGQRPGFLAASQTLLSSTPMTSPGNLPTLTLKLERDSSPFTPRSPKNFPLQVDISREDEYEKFLAELCNAEHELGLARQSYSSGPTKPRKARGKGNVKHRIADDGAQAAPGEIVGLALPQNMRQRPKRSVGSERAARGEERGQSLASVHGGELGWTKRCWMSDVDEMARATATWKSDVDADGTKIGRERRGSGRGARDEVERYGRDTRRPESTTQGKQRADVEQMASIPRSKLHPDVLVNNAFRRLLPSPYAPPTLFIFVKINNRFRLCNTLYKPPKKKYLMLRHDPSRIRTGTLAGLDAEWYIPWRRAAITPKSLVNYGL
ncbi:hypothetical protein DFH06DRAFT_1141268 [Mycena polygramma]|nr:hypothetical protein DFH06DRAFT_1141268 [Mycena polygramma]